MSEQDSQTESIACADEAEWLSARRGGLGSSDAPAILEVSAWKSPLQVYSEKLGIIEPDAVESEAMEWGKALEPVIAQRYVKETGRFLQDPGRFTIQRSRRYPLMLATLDRFVAAGNHRGLGILEIKTTGSFKADQWEEEPPLPYQVQVQHQLAVMGFAWASIAVLIGGQKFRWLDVERNDRFIALLIEREAAFWERLQKHEPPPPDPSEATKEILAKLYPKDVGTSVALPGEALEWDRLRVEAKDQIKHWEAKEREAENLLKAHIGDATFGVLPSGITYSWKAGIRRGYTVEETSVRTLRRQEPKGGK